MTNFSFPTGINSLANVWKSINFSYFEQKRKDLYVYEMCLFQDLYKSKTDSQ